MNESINHIPYTPIVKHNYDQWFQEVRYNNKTLSDSERKEFAVVIDKAVAQYSEGLPLMKETLESTKDQHDEFHELEREVVSIILFVVITMIDSMVACKYFFLADKDYDRRFMRGKMKVILNEGFKKLYGFTKDANKKSEWRRLDPLMKYFSDEIRKQYQEMSHLLDTHSRSSSWWKEERDLETHIDAVKLYKSRQKEIIESKVMTDSMRLFNTLMAVNSFLTNVHACLLNFLVMKYNNGELND